MIYTALKTYDRALYFFEVVSTVFTEIELFAAVQWLYSV